MKKIQSPRPILAVAFYHHIKLNPFPIGQMCVVVERERVSDLMRPQPRYTL